MTELIIILDFTIIFLLVTAIIYGFVLSGRIKLIRQSGRELSHLFRSFDDTILRAESSIADLKKVSSLIEVGLQKKIDKAAMQIDDLEFLGTRASQAADKVGVAIVNFKKIEDKISANNSNNNRMVTMPQGPLKNRIPEKPPAQMRTKKQLEDLLGEISATQQNIQKKPVQNNNRIVASGLVNQENDNNTKKQFSIASALKVLGYGDA
jgi:hypothetical protein